MSHKREAILALLEMMLTKAKTPGFYFNKIKEHRSTSKGKHVIMNLILLPLIHQYTTLTSAMDLLVTGVDRYLQTHEVAPTTSWQYAQEPQRYYTRLVSSQAVNSYQFGA